MIAAEDCVLVLLAAGRSQRMGDLGSKLDEPFLGRALGLHVAVALEDMPFRERVAVVGKAQCDYATHGYTIVRNDDPALIAALATDAPYVGALGSRRSHAARRERLAAEGLSAAQIDRIDAPVGIDIGAIGPAEIALSIAAAMVGAFHDRR